MNRARRLLRRRRRECTKPSSDVLTLEVRIWIPHMKKEKTFGIFGSDGNERQRAMDEANRVFEWKRKFTAQGFYMPPPLVLDEHLESAAAASTSAAAAAAAATSSAAATSKKNCGSVVCERANQYDMLLFHQYTVLHICTPTGIPRAQKAGLSAEPSRRSARDPRSAFSNNKASFIDRIDRAGSTFWQSKWLSLFRPVY